ncbi:aldehyde dehydrogenase family protein [uncultured Microscilla sp.]|uniref:L-piperidine-6-carboxylate dehydrogenase n=1 Tax=uncultured Microscilla sp. TaxID=432653 RepID=UPI0026128D28|nr:aldehyde dehydrogenase family protein [uncultured Microscilla sp.]
MEATTKTTEEIQQILSTLGIKDMNPSYGTGQVYGSVQGGTQRAIHSPIDGQYLATVQYATREEYDKVIGAAQKAFVEWRQMPAPKRGEIVRQIGNKLREYKEPLGKLVTLEMGKIYQEGLGEVQEMIDICDFAVGQSRQLYGKTIASERPEHQMLEKYQPLGIIGIISAFNFPVAVWSWNAMLAAICGDVCVWKPSEKTPLCAIACQHIAAQVLKENNLPEGIFSFINGDAELGKWMAEDKRVPLVSATGSTRMGKSVAQTVAGRLGKSLLELGGNNAIIMTANANIEMAMRATLFGAVGTCGQRCTTTRRLIIHDSIYDNVKDRLVKAYGGLSIGNPLEASTLVGPLIDKEAVQGFTNALESVQKEGGKLLTGGDVLSLNGLEGGNYVQPAIVEAENSYQMVQEETFAPILYLIKYSGDVMNAINIQNDVKQGLSSAIFSDNVQETETFLSFRGSDCGIANVNIGTSGAEIGGAFGGEKETGGGRESGSDSWKVYMRRQTNTINYSQELPLAQGIKFDVD